MDLQRITDWTLLIGASVEIRQLGTPVCSGHVDAVTDDGKILSLRASAQNRRLFEKAEFYEAWATEDRDGFHYEATKQQADIELPAESRYHYFQPASRPLPGHATADI